MPKLDKQDLIRLYSASPQEPTFVNAPRPHFLMLDGRGDLDAGPEFQQAVEALFSVSYTLKFMIKKDQGLDYCVMPLEGLWWADDPVAFTAGDKDRWQWTLMIRQPEVITPELVDSAKGRTTEDKNLPLLEACGKHYEIYLSDPRAHPAGKMANHYPAARDA